MSRPPVLLSVIIPTLNEAPRLAGCLGALVPFADSPEAEIIVSDGGSGDETVARARSAGVAVVTGSAGRAIQMNAGAHCARGRLLAFLHADTVPGAAACQRLCAIAGQPGEVWGRFDVRLSGGGVAFRTIEWMMNARSRVTGIATGDQLMFVSRSLFQRVGGFPEVALMEDIRLSAALRRRQRPLCLKDRVETSSRKWRQDGVARTVFLMWALRFAHALGADPTTLARHYYGR